MEVEAQVGDVVDDPHSELASRRGCGELFEHRGRHGGRELLGCEAIPSADDERRLGPGGEGDDDVLEQRLARGSGFLRAIEHGDPAHGRRQRRDKSGGVERPEQVDVQKSDPLAPGEKRFHCFLRRADA